MNTRLEDLKNYLAMSHHLRLQANWNGDLPEPLTYPGIVLDIGREWEAGEEFGAPYSGAIEAMPNACFFNCVSIITEGECEGNPDKYRYVEGWATSVIPMHHAWLIDSEDRVVDPTWGHRPETAYCGIVFTYAEIVDVVVRSHAGFSMLYPSTINHPLIGR